MDPTMEEEVEEGFINPICFAIFLLFLEIFFINLMLFTFLKNRNFVHIIKAIRFFLGFSYC